MIVCKFGGTFVSDAEAIRRTGEIVRAARKRRPIVVVSALAGVTGELLEIGGQAAHGGRQLHTALQRIHALGERHARVIADLFVGTGDHNAVRAELAMSLRAKIGELRSLVEALAVLGDASPRSLDAAAAFGECLSSEIVAAGLRTMGVPADHVDARRVMITDGDFGRAKPIPEAIREAAVRELTPLVDAGIVPVLGGYIGATYEGVRTTLGRGGSDYSASLIGVAVGAEAIEIWTDVDGICCADPRVVPTARPVGHVHFDEAAELAAFGAKVLQPRTIAPAVHAGIPVFVLNSRTDGREGGTRIGSNAPRRAVTAIASKRDVTLVNVRSPAMLLREGFLGELFAVFGRHRVSVDVVSTSEVSVSVTVDAPARLEALLPELNLLGDVTVERGHGLVALIGGALKRSPQAMSRALAALGAAAVELHMLSLSATGINFTAVVNDNEVDELVRRLHGEFFELGTVHRGVPFPPARWTSGDGPESVEEMEASLALATSSQG